MTRRRHLEAVPAVEAPLCLLCEQECPVLELEDGELEALELCGRCNQAFHTLARSLEPAPAGPVQVAGQLELDSIGQVCLCGHDQDSHDQDLQDGPGEALEGEAPIVCRHCVCELYEQAGQ